MLKPPASTIVAVPSDCKQPVDRRSLKRNVITLKCCGTPHGCFSRWRANRNSLQAPIGYHLPYDCGGGEGFPRARCAREDNYRRFEQFLDYPRLMI